MGTLPGPTPSVGVPVSCAMRTIALVPVARISASCGWRMIRSRYSRGDLVTHWMASGGGPRGVGEDARRLADALPRGAVRAEDDRVAGLEADQRLEDRRRGRVVDGDGREDRPFRLGNLADPGRLIVG